MEAKEIDLEMYTTCRLCIKEKGSYQITPMIQQQLTEHFDLTVEAYDGLPQVICKSCKPILDKFYAIKNEFKANQEILKNKILVNKKNDIKEDDTQSKTHSVKNIASTSYHDRKTIETHSLKRKPSLSEDDDTLIQPKKKLASEYKGSTPKTYPIKEIASSNLDTTLKTYTQKIIVGTSNDEKETIHIHAITKIASSNTNDNITLDTLPKKVIIDLSQDDDTLIQPKKKLASEDKGSTPKTYPIKEITSSNLDENTTLKTSPQKIIVGASNDEKETIHKHAITKIARSNTNDNITLDTLPKKLIIDLIQDNDIIVQTQPKSNNIKKCKNKTRFNSYSASNSTNGHTKINTRCKSTDSLKNMWKNYFQEYFVCRYCDKHCKSQKSVANHLACHSNLVNITHNLLNGHCTVLLNRVDYQPNLTGDAGQTNIVVLDAKTLVLDNHCIDYYKTYLPKGCSSNRLSSEAYSFKNSENVDDGYRQAEKKINECIEINPEVDQMKHKVPRKRMRLLSSTSSAETVILDKKEDTNKKENGQEKYVDNNPKIKCEDTSELDTENTDREKAVQIIDNIILSSYKKYLMSIRQTPPQNKNNEILNRKVINIGRKIMSKQGMVSTGLLKYLEHKNLSIEWSPTKASAGKETDYVYSMTKFKDPQKHNSMTGFISLKKKSIPKETANSNTATSIMSIVYSEDRVAIQNDTTSVTGTLIPLNTTHLSDTEQLVGKSQLLNAYPVANPKQVPKKKLSNEVKSNQNYENAQLNKTGYIVGSHLICLDNSDFDPAKNSNIPVINSTSSMAKVTNDKNNKVDTGGAKMATKPISEVNNRFQRIKCKPVAELMEQPTFCKFNEHDTPTTSTVLGGIQNTLNINYSKVLDRTQNKSVIVHNNSQNISNSNALPASSNVSETLDDEVVLHTITMPNTLTRCPFTYFTKILQLHNITLLDSLTVLPSTFVNLINFKLVVSHDIMSVYLNISLSTYENSFCIKVKNKVLLDVKELKFSWQWHIIQSLYDLKLVRKVKDTAQSLGLLMIYIEQFFSILKSVKKQ